MNVIKTKMNGLLILEPKVIEDERGYFFESYNRNFLEKNGINFTFVQDNQSKSGYGVVRGLHYQLEPYGQAKLVRVLSGKILDVVVDIRKESPTFLEEFHIELSEQNKKQLLIPRGFAHGFSVLSANATVFYKCDNIYNKESERGIIWNDPKLNIDWMINKNEMILSEKDKFHPATDTFETNFIYNRNQ